MSAWIEARMANSLPFAAFVAGVTALLTTLVFGPFCIRCLKSRFRERIASDSVHLNALHAAKKNTPTMGGILIVGSTLISLLAWADRSSPLVWLNCLTLVFLLLLGGVDDWIKLKTSRKGLTVRQKLGFQCMIALLAAIGVWVIRSHANVPASITLPFASTTISPGPIWIPWAVLVIVGASNAVNLTDGLDGLATGCTAITSTFLAVSIACGVSVIADDASRQTSIISSAALAGSTLGFLWWNRHPARVFMGDAGSLPIGGLLALAALSTGCELILAILGIVFVAETLSVIIQVAWYRRTGRRVFLCSPLHNHFVFRGIAEQKIVNRLWLAAMLAGLLGLMSVSW